MQATWIVTANASRARFYADTKQAEHLEEITDMVNTASRERGQDIETDGMSPQAAGKSAHGTGGALPNKQYQPAQTPGQREAELFARSVCDFLEQGHKEGRYDELAIVASPEFLGVLRQQLDPQLQPLVCVEINKDYTHSTPDQLREQVQAHRLH